MNAMIGILDLLRQEPLTDILVVGLIREDGAYNTKSFHQMGQDLYLVFESKLIRCTSIHWSDLQMEIINKISPDFYFPHFTETEIAREIDPEDEFCISSIYHQCLRNFIDANEITALRVFTDRQSNLKEGFVKCAEFQFGDQPSLFLDPMNVFGIRIGTNQHVAEWIAEAESTSEKAIEEMLWYYPFNTDAC